MNIEENNMNQNRIPLSEKYVLTIKEASLYFNLGEKKLKTLAAEHMDDGFAVMNGNRHLIIREKFQEFLVKTSSV